MVATWPCGRERLIDSASSAFHGHTTAQQRAQALDEMLRPTAEVGERALLDLPVLAITLAEQDGGGANSGSERFQYAWHIESRPTRKIKTIKSSLHGYTRA